MSVTAKLKYLRIAPRKVRLTADLIRGKKAIEAQNALRFLTNKPAGVILKLLNQAMANARNNFKLDEANLYISKLTVDGGPILKRFRPRARGSAYAIQKKTSHILIVLDEIKKGVKKEAKKEEAVEKEETVVKNEAVQENHAKTTRPQKAVIKLDKEAKPTVQADNAKRKVFRRQTF
jgi:large subunit ribosomal protein L22